MRISRLSLCAACLLGLLTTAGAEPDLARVTFLIPPERHAEFAALYETRLLPILQQYGLNPTEQPGRPAPDSAFVRLFIAAGPAAIDRAQRALAADSTWTARMRELGQTFGTTIQTAAKVPVPGKGDQLAHHLGPHASAARAPAPVELRAVQGHWQRYGRSDGLANDRITDVLVDRAGLVWCSTHQGVSRYDGYRWTTFTRADGLLASGAADLLEDRAGQIWAASNDGLSRWDGGAWTAFRSPVAHGGKIHSLYQDRAGDIWLAGWKGFFHFDGRDFTHFAGPGAEIYIPGPLSRDQQARLWVFGWGIRTHPYQGGPFAAVEPLGRAISWPSAAFEDRAGRLWLGTNRGVLRYADGQWTAFTAAQGWPAAGVHSFCEDDQGRLWLGTKGGGLFRWDGVKIDSIALGAGLAGRPVQALAQDPSGQLWVGTDRGLARYDERAWATYTAFADGRPLPPRFVSALRDRDDRLWFGAGDQILRYDQGTWHEFTAADGLGRGGGLWDMLEDRDGQLWFATWGGGATRFDGRTWTTFDRGDGLASIMIISLVQDRRGHIWAGTASATEGHGVSRYDGEAWTTYTTADGLGHDRVTTIGQDHDGALWFGTARGATRFDGRTWTVFTESDGLGHNWIEDLLADRRGQVWAATSGGASRFDGARWTNFTTADGLAGDMLTTLYEDRQGHLWFGTTSGVSRYDGRVFQTLDRRDGLAGDAVWSIVQDAEGAYWFGTMGDGLNRYQPPPPAPPPVQVDAVVADRRYAKPDSVTIPASQQLIAVDFHATSLTTRPEAMVYRYRLRGHDDQWTNTHAHRVEYADLPVGQYTFEVIAVDRDLVYSEEPASVHLTIRPQTFTSPVRLAAVELDDVFASLAASYQHRGLGQVSVTNDGAETLQTTLRFFVPQLMRRPFEVPVDLAPGANQQIALHPQLDFQIPDQTQPQTFAAQVSLELPEFSVKANPAPELTLYPPGALRWDGVAPAAAFITSNAPQVADFTRPTLLAFEKETDVWGEPLHNVFQAMVLFEALKTHGVRYIADANTPYARARADQDAIDHIQYPAQVLASKAGDCDDLAVLYAALLENAGIATALVDYPDHIFLLLDTGVARERAYRLPLEQRHYVPLGETLWIPIEVTQLDQSFEQAWHMGIEQLAALSGLELRRRLVRTSQAWQNYPAAAPNDATANAPPARKAFQAAFAGQQAALQRQIEVHFKATYLDPLTRRPDDDALRTQLLKLYLALRQFDTAIQTGLTNLLDKRGDQGAILNQLGIAYFLKGEFTQAALHFERAAQSLPDDRGVQQNLQRAMQTLGRAASGQQPVAALDAGDGSRASSAALDVDSFYWVE
ncbi:MAG: hypothetical protein GKR89_30435 [Candidatus Latescibacteria bacterium]|nr:hypothetical protein [Candidatus Latescibacterota bacterium]